MSWAGNVWGNEAWGQSDNGGSWTNREASPSSTYATYAWLRADWSAWTEGPAGGNSQASPGGDQKESKKQISFYTTLGMKHPLPADKRRELLITLLRLIRQKHVNTLAVFPSVALAQWDLLQVHAALFYLCKASPSTQLRILRDPAEGSRTFTIDFAAGKLHETFVSLYPGAEQQQNAYQSLLACSFENPQEIIKLATKEGFHPHEVELGRQESRRDPRGGSPSAPHDVEPRPCGDLHRRELARRSTDEELDRLRKKKRSF